MRRQPLVALMLGALMVGLFAYAGSVSTPETFQALSPAKQRPAPAFTLPDQQGTSLGLVDLRGKVVVVRFWVTW